MRDLVYALRWRLLFLCISLAVTIGLYVKIELDAAPPAIFPINPAAGVQRSRPFTVHQRGLYLVELKFEGEAARHRLDCEPASPQPFDCKPKPALVSWTIFRKGRLVARDSLGPTAAVDVVVRREDNQYSLEIGSLELKPSAGYVLEVQPTDALREAKATHTAIALALHPWDVKKGLGLVVVLLLAGAVTTAAFVSVAVATFQHLSRSRNLAH